MPLRVAHLTGEFRDDGIGVYISRLAAAVDAESLLITSAIATSDANRGRLLAPFADVVVRDRDLGAIGPANVAALARTLRAARLDAVHVHELSLLGAVGPACRLAGVRVFGTSHLEAGGSASWNRWKKRAFRFGLNRLLCDGYFAISSEIADEYRDLYGIPEGRIVPALSGIDLDRFRPPTAAERADARRRLGLPEGRIAFLQLGRLGDVKRPLLTLEAFEKLATDTDRDAALLFGGHGPLEDDIRRRAAALPDGRVRLLGFVDPLETLHAVDALLLPSAHEGFALVVAEAMACGVVPVRTPTAGCRDQIEHGVNGFVLERPDAENLAALMETLLDDDRRGKMSARAAETARRKFDAARTATVIETAYREGPTAARELTS